MVYEGKGLLDINIIRKMMEIEEGIMNKEEHKKFCVARQPLDGETEVVCDFAASRSSGAQMLVMDKDWKTMTQ